MPLFEETDLGRLETYANDNPIGIKFFFANIDLKQLDSIIKSRKKDKSDLKTGIKYSQKMLSGEYSQERKDLLYKDLVGLYSQNSNLQEIFTSFETFLLKLSDLVRANTQTRSDIAATRRAKLSTATELLGSVENEFFGEAIEKKIPKFYPIPLFTNFTSTSYEVTEKDQWLLDHLCCDEQGKYYWRFRTPINDLEGCVYPLSYGVLKSGVTAIGDDVDFWNKFFEEEGIAIRDFFIEADRYVKSYCSGTDNSLENVALPEDMSRFEGGLKCICPTVIIQSMDVGFLVTGKHFEATCRLKGHSSFDRTSQQQVFAMTLLQTVPKSKLTRIRVFDDVSSKAVHKLPARPVITSVPDHHPDLLTYGCPTWDAFLHSKHPEGYTKFPSQRMGELRLAKAVVSFCDKDDYSRQILALAGEGDDGKSTFIDALRGIFGGQLVSDGKTQGSLDSEFGLQSAINKRILVFDDIPEPYKFFNHEKVKQISGAANSTLEVNRKFLTPWSWCPSGCKIIMSANKPYSLIDEATITRCMPLVFLKNYSLKNVLDPQVLKEGLIKEGANFIRWCYETCLYYNTVKNVNGEVCPLFKGAHMKEFTDLNSMMSFIGKNIIICSDEQFDFWMQGLLDLTPDSVSVFRSQRTQAYETESQIPHKATPFILLKQEDSEDAEVNSFFDSLCDKLFVKDENAILKSKDFSLNLLNFVCMKDSETTYAKELREIFVLLRASGLQGFKDVTSLQNSRVYRNFKQHLCDRFHVDFVKMRQDGDTFKGCSGIRMYSLEYFMGETSGDAPAEPPADDSIF